MGLYSFSGSSRIGLLLLALCRLTFYLRLTGIWTIILCRRQLSAFVGIIYSIWHSIYRASHIQAYTPESYHEHSAQYIQPLIVFLLCHIFLCRIESIFQAVIRFRSFYGRVSEQCRIILGEGLLFPASDRVIVSRGAKTAAISAILYGFPVAWLQNAIIPYLVLILKYGQIEIAAGHPTNP